VGGSGARSVGGVKDTSARSRLHVRDIFRRENYARLARPSRLRKRNFGRLRYSPEKDQDEKDVKDWTRLRRKGKSCVRGEGGGGRTAAVDSKKGGTEAFKNSIRDAHEVIPKEKGGGPEAYERGLQAPSRKGARVSQHKVGGREIGRRFITSISSSWQSTAKEDGRASSMVER